MPITIVNHPMYNGGYGLDPYGQWPYGSGPILVQVAMAAATGTGVALDSGITATGAGFGRSTYGNSPYGSGGSVVPVLVPTALGSGTAWAPSGVGDTLAAAAVAQGVGSAYNAEFIAGLPPGVRAGPGLVGYLGNVGDLTVLNPGGTIPSGWSGSWDGDTLEVHANNVVIDHYKLNCAVALLGNNPTVTHCVVTPQAVTTIGIYLLGTSRGVFTVTDTTVVCLADDTLDTYAVNGIASDSGLVARRCDVSGSGDGIHFVSQPSSSDAIISQCYIHDQSFVKPEPGPGDQHLDGIQHFAHATTAGYATIEHTYIAETRSAVISGFPSGVPMSSGVTIGPPDGTDPLTTVTFNNNYVASGGYHLRLNYRLQNCVITNNDFGAIHDDEAGYVAADSPSEIVTWSNNRDENHNLIAQP